MRVYDCIGIIKDLKGNTVGYTLRNLHGNTIGPTVAELKNAMSKKLIVVGNMTLTSNNRLILKNKSHFDRKNFTVKDNVTFEMWMNNILESIKERYGGEKGIRCVSIAENGTYDLVYCQVSDIPVAGGNKIDIYINISKTAPTDKKHIVIAGVEDVRTGNNIHKTLGMLEAPLYSEENTKTVEKTLKFALGSLSEKIRKYYQNNN